LATVPTALQLYVLATLTTARDAAAGCDTLNHKGTQLTLIKKQTLNTTADKHGTHTTQRSTHTQKHIASTGQVLHTQSQGTAKLAERDAHANMTCSSCMRYCAGCQLERMHCPVQQLMTDLHGCSNPQAQHQQHAETCSELPLPNN
jgi:hypothetical protein